MDQGKRVLGLASLSCDARRPNTHARLKTNTHRRLGIKGKPYVSGMVPPAETKVLDIADLKYRASLGRRGLVYKTDSLVWVLYCFRPPEKPATLPSLSDAFRR